MKFSLLLITLLMSASALAQNADMYVPPPLFGGSHLEEPETRPEIAAPASKAPVAPKAVQPIVAPKPKTKPIPSPQKTPPPQKQEASQGVVTGPKTMPAVKKKSVEVEPTYTPDKDTSENMLERYQKQNIDVEEPKPEPNNSPPPVLSEKTEWALTLSDNQIEPDETQKLVLMNEVVPALDMWGEARILIYSEALALGQNNMNASRRLALNRALEVRKFLTKQAINPSRIDVRAVKAPSGSATPNVIQLKIIK